ncbi:MAG: hypothetical protein KDB27_29285 [Planctomycetales bacterium]|nr:hypothetical protein [Planctomycetales bacterium]
MKLPAIVIGIGLLIVGYLVFRSLVATLKISAKILMWMIVLIAGFGAAYMYSQGMIGNGGSSSDVPYQSQSDSPTYR